MELVVPMYNAHPYFSLKIMYKGVCIIYSKIQYVQKDHQGGKAPCTQAIKESSTAISFYRKH